MGIANGPMRSLCVVVALLLVVSGSYVRAEQPVRRNEHHPSAMMEVDARSHLAASVAASSQQQSQTSAQTQAGDGKFIKKLAGMAKKFLGGGGPAAAALKIGANTAAGIATQKLAGALSNRPLLPPQPRPYGIGSPQVSGAASRITYSDSQCVVCQYVVQRVHAEMLLNGLGQSVPYKNQLPSPANDGFSRAASEWATAQSSAGVPMLATPPGSSSSSGGDSFLEIEAFPTYNQESESFMESDTDTSFDDQDSVTQNANSEKYDLPELPEDRLPHVSSHLAHAQHHSFSHSHSTAVSSPSLAEVGTEIHSQSDEEEPQDDSYEGRMRFLERRGFFDKIKSGFSKGMNMVKGFLGGNKPQQTPGAPVGKQGKKKKKTRMMAPPYVPRFKPHRPPPPDSRSKTIWKTPRERADDMYAFRPVQTRYEGLYDLPRKVQQRAMERFENQQMMEVVFGTVERICTNNMPRDFYQSCYDLMRKYQFITRSLMWRDRPDSICMHMDLCDAKSYVQANPHSRLT